MFQETVTKYCDRKYLRNDYFEQIRGLYVGKPKHRMERILA